MFINNGSGSLEGLESLKPKLTELSKLPEPFFTQTIR